MKSVAMAIALLALTAGAAHAFTYDGRSTSSADGTKLTDPDDQLTDGSHKSNKSKSGFSMHFSGGPSTAQPGFGVQNRFLPSGNRVFASPFDQGNFGSPAGNN